MQTYTEFKQSLQTIRSNLLYGTGHSNSSLSKLNGQKDVLERLFQEVETPLYEEFYKSHIRDDERAYCIWPRLTLYPEFLLMTRPVEFPAPRDIHINMMPVYLGIGIYRSLPNDYQHYANFIWRHCLSHYWNPIKENEIPTTRIGYLTIHEGWVPVGQSQRRPGLHIERPGAIASGGTWHNKHSDTFKAIAWGLGAWHEDGLPEDGIFMASTLDHSCAIWDKTIENPEDITDKHGGIEILRPYLGTPRLLKANEMYWFTDRTPHESLPVQAPENDPTATRVYRQFFRLVVGPISVWYSKHNTPNPLGIQPDAPISDEDKFQDS
jgi:hypothetical protein